MDDKWIDNIKDRMSEFEMTPPEGLWDSINKEIRQRKLRRWRIWSGAAAVSAAIIAGLYFIFTSHELELPELMAPAIISDAYDSNEVTIEKGKENITFARETSILSHKKNGKKLYSAATRKDNTDPEITTEE
ncbi:MAG: hypothetical protein K2G13_02290, partial [Muribaculaceae bacterium]|nr:hypothetical protein [Muribaculaceae bacterium]